MLLLFRLQLGLFLISQFFPISDYLGIATIYWHTLYDIEVRSNIIGQTFDEIADSLQDLDVSQFPVYDLNGNSFDETSNVLKQMEMLYVDQKQSCTNYFASNDKGYIFKTGYVEALMPANIVQTSETFICFTSLIFEGTFTTCRWARVDVKMPKNCFYDTIIIIFYEKKNFFTGHPENFPAPWENIPGPLSNFSICISC